MLLDVGEPRSYIYELASVRGPSLPQTAKHTIKAPPIRHIIDQQNPHSTAIISRRDGAKPLLPRGIPYLQLHPLAVQLDGPDLEVDADGRDEGRRERVFAEAQEAAGFAHAAVTD